MGQHIFLSYGRKDVYPKGTTDNAVEQAQHFTIVEKVYTHLNQSNRPAWLDKHDLTSDRSFPDGLQLAIELWFIKRAVGAERSNAVHAQDAVRIGILDGFVLPSAFQQNGDDGHTPREGVLPFALAPLGLHGV